MGHPSTLYRFRIDLSDIDRGVYELLDFRAALHPSETPVYLLTRVLAFALNAQDDLEFSPGGLSDPDQPCLRVTNPNGGLRLWVEVGNPSAKKLHKAAKASQVVKVYTYKDPDALLREAESQPVHKSDEIAIYSLDPRFLEHVASTLQKDNKWSLVHTEGALTLSQGEISFSTELREHSIRAQK